MTLLGDLEKNPPTGVAGIETISCECGWEIVLMVPEENFKREWMIFNHLSEKHGINFPLLTCTMH